MAVVISIDPVVDHRCKNGCERVENMEENKAQYIKFRTKLGHSMTQLFNEMGICLMVCIL